MMLAILVRCFTDDGTHRAFWCIIYLRVLLNLVLVIPEFGIGFRADVTVVATGKGRVIGRKNRGDSANDGASLG